MASAMIDNILRKSGQTGLLKFLTHYLSGTELNSLLLEVFQRRCETIQPGQLMKNYRANRFVKPADLPVLEMKQMEIDLLKHFDQNGFAPIELSPVSILGSCSAVALASQNKILSALRGTEVLADATNAIALHISDLYHQHKIESEAPAGTLKFATVQRHVRTQSIKGKGLTPHFKIACLVSAGLDNGSYSFEKENLCDHIRTMRELYLSYYKVADVQFRLICRQGYSHPLALANAVKNHIVSEIPGTQITIVDNPEKENGYYKGIQYKIDIDYNGKTYEIGDGGFVDWTQSLCQNNKHRMLSTGIGFDFMYRIMQDSL
jgi:hypothetical protein